MMYIVLSIIILDMLHLQKPNSEPVYCERLLSLLPNDCYTKIRVHEHYYLKQEFDLKGIHINNPDAPVPDDFKRNVTRSTCRISDLKDMKKKYTVVVVTHNMQQALDYGNRLLMMDAGEIILDISGEEKQKLTLDDLAEHFKEIKKHSMTNDQMVLQ